MRHAKPLYAEMSAATDDPIQPNTVRLNIEGLQQSHEGYFELRIDGPMVQVPDLSFVAEQLTASGFAPEVVERCMDKLGEGLYRGQLVHLLASRITPA